VLEKIVVSVGLNPLYKFSSNLEAGPLMVQLVKEGEKWRLRLAWPEEVVLAMETTT
jgi:hypothetical protein